MPLSISQKNSPSDSHEVKGEGLPQLLFFAFLLVQCIGIAAVAWRRGGPVDGTLFLTLDLPELLAIYINRGCSILSVICAALLLRWREERLAAFITFWTLTWAGCAWLQNASYFEGLTPFAWAIRALAPAAGWWWLSSKQRIPSPMSGLAWALRVACATTFATHGVEALRHHPKFVDLILGTDLRLLDGALTQAKAERMLDVIGWVDIIVAILVLARPRNIPVLAWMTFWGLITAMSRATCWGLSGLDMALMRFMHGGMPLVLLLLLLFSYRKTAATKTPNLPAEEE